MTLCFFFRNRKESKAYYSENNSSNRQTHPSKTKSKQAHCFPIDNPNKPKPKSNPFLIKMSKDLTW